MRQRQLNVSINGDLADRIAVYAMYTGQSLAHIIERAAWEYLEANWQAPTPPRESRAPTSPNVREVSEEKRFDDDERVLSLYEELTGNRARESDRIFLEEVRQYGYSCIAAALFVGRSRYSKKINSLKFFQNNILEVAAWQPDKIKKELRFQMEMMNRRRGQGSA